MSSLAELLKEMCLEAQFVQITHPKEDTIFKDHHDADANRRPWAHRRWLVIVSYPLNPDAGVLTCRYRTGTGIQKPTVADVIASLVSDSSAIDAGSFDEWASDLGYDPDSRRAYRIYKRCLKIGRKLHKFFTKAELDKIAEAAADY